MLPSALPARRAPTSVRVLPICAASSAVAAASACSEASAMTAPARSRWECVMSRVLLRLSEGCLEAQVDPAAVVLPPGAGAARHAARGGGDGVRMAAGVGHL